MPLSLPSVYLCAVFSGREGQVMSKSESVNDGVGNLRKRLQRLFKKKCCMILFLAECRLSFHPLMLPQSVFRESKPGLHAEKKNRNILLQIQL